MKTYNLWKSSFTNNIFACSVDFIPQFKGWELIDTIQAKSQFEADNIAILRQIEG